MQKSKYEIKQTQMLFHMFISPILTRSFPDTVQELIQEN